MSLALRKIMNQVQEFKENAGEKREIYFRGQRSNYQLLPSLLRNIDKYSHELDVTENHYYCNAWVMGATELVGTKSSWEALAQFQHYKIPTRLLDWTSSLLSAIYFAIEICLSCNDYKKNGKCKKLKNKCQGNPAIWLLDPQGMHVDLHGYKLSNYMGITIGVDEIQDYEEGFVTKVIEWRYKNGPIFLEIPWKNERISSQKGYFTFHPNNQPLEQIAGGSGWLRKIEIARNDRTNIIKEFNVLGINEHDIYSDLSSLGQYLNRIS